MGNRSRFVVVGSAAGLTGVVVRARRRARLRRAAGGMTDAIMPSLGAGMASDEPRSDDLHAPGHAHLAPPRDERRRRGLRSRPFAKRQHGLRHPGKL